MSLATCPTAVIEAPIERVWNMLSQPSTYDQWWDAQTRTIAPEGAAHAGQLIHARTIELGKTWDVRIVVEGVDALRHTLDLTTRGPLGITVRNHIVCTAVDASRTRVSFG
jgi:ligand-binding SRPBCC domain-containing protein